MDLTAVIGDLVASRSLDPNVRRDVQARLRDHFAGLVRSSGPIRSQPTITLGDGFQGLFSAAEDPSAVVGFLTRVQELARPADVRFGIGIVPLTTDLTDVAIGMDGPCFHHAREAIEWSRREDLACGVRGGDPLDADMLSHLLSTLLRIRRQWSSEQREAIITYLGLPEESRTWSAVADILGRTPSAITQRQQGAQWKWVRALSAVVARGLARLETGAPP